MSSKIYTRTGDAGTTSLVDGTRIPKDALCIEAYGAVDEANSWVGAALAFGTDPMLCPILELVQHRLYNCSSNLATPAGSGIAPTRIDATDIEFLEQAIDSLEGRSGAIRGFVLPGGAKTAALLHVARTVCRRAERRMWTLARQEPVDALVLKFVNRTSDLLFAAARYAAAVEQSGDVHWNPSFPVPDLPQI
ncbi:MAG: cob(I)yrinic acid a,c-diamide adenosyltransferase [Myxococcota bacterium]|nr:cob(I)yrinic acid a,c-diamide adenosyltransferase [Myxococcota bacterium]